MPGRGECVIITKNWKSAERLEYGPAAGESGHITAGDAGRVAVAAQDACKLERGLSHETFTELKAHIQKG